MTTEDTGRRTDGPGCSCGCGAGAPGDERRAPRALYNPPGRTALDYRVGTYGSFLAAMLDRLASPAYPALRGLTVRTPDDPSIGLLDTWAVLGDLLTFHSERIADEGYLRTADDHRSLALLGRLVGHRPRPGISADTHLAYTLDRDPRADGDTPVLIPRGARSHSVPGGTGEEARTFETDEDLWARSSWNELKVRRRKPALLVPEDLSRRSELYVAGTSTGLATGDRLLFLFGADAETGGGERLLIPVARTRADREDDVTAIGLPESAPPSLAELVAETRQWITQPPPEETRDPEAGEPTAETPNPRPVSRLIEEFDEQVLAPLREDLDRLTTPDAFARRLVEPLERLAEAEALAGPYEEVAAWFGQLAAMLAELRERAAELGPSRPDAEGAVQEPGRTAGEKQYGSDAVRALGGLLPALRTGAARPPAARSRFGPGSGLAAHLLTALGPRFAGGLHPVWRRAAPNADPEPTALRALLAMRVTAAPFGSTAPLKPVQDERGRVIRQSDWPLTGAALTTVRIVFDTTGKTPEKAEFIQAEAGVSVQRGENLTADQEFDFASGRIRLANRTGTDGGPEAGVTVTLLPELPDLTVFVGRPGEDGRIHVTVRDGGTLDEHLEPGARKQRTIGAYEVSARRSTAGEPAAVEIGIATVPAEEHRDVLRLDTVQDAITVGSWIAVDRPRKGQEGGIPGDAKLARVITRVTAVRTASYTDYGITGRGTELVLADPWLDEHDVLLSHIRDATVHAAGEPLRPADEPLGDELHGDGIELAELYDGLRPGRTLAVSGERTDIPGTTGVPGTELAVIASVEHERDPALPGDHVRTTLTLTAGLVHRYRRDTVRILGNVVPASHGESREEAVGSGDASRAHQTFALWQSPLTWLPGDDPLGADPTLEVRVDGLLWHRVDSLAGRGPTERVYVLGRAGDGRTTVTFGDGVHGARLPTGHENVRARYRFGTGRAANLPAGRITQAVTRPLGVTAVTNPLPATGGADGDGPGLTRRTVPLAVSALDRLVSVRDYEDFARSRAGIGRAAARELFDGRRTVLHVTVAGADDTPLTEDSDLLRSLRASLAEYGDPRLPVRVDVRETVLLLLAARIKVAPDHAWEYVEPRVRRALLGRLGYPGRELGQPARLSEVLATAQSVPGVDYVDVDSFTGIPASTGLDGLAEIVGGLDEPRTTVPARSAEYAEDIHRVTAPEGETLTDIAARHGIGLAALLRLNPDITDTRRLPRGRSVFVFRGIRPAQLALFPLQAADTLILTEVK